MNSDRSPTSFSRAIRRAILLAIVAAGVVGGAHAQNPAAPAATPSPQPTLAPASPAAGSTSPTAAPAMVSIDRLMAIGPLPDLVQGSVSAPITIVEYASMTCSHCAAFHETTWPQLKAKYIDTGRAKFILREFPLDPLATAGFMIARCAGPDKRNLLVDQLLSQQKSWAFVDKPIEPLLAMAEQFGISQADFEACLKNQDLYERIGRSRDRAAESFDIDSTPTFFVDGRKLRGELALSDFEHIIDPPSK